MVSNGCGGGIPETEGQTSSLPPLFSDAESPIAINSALPTLLLLLLFSSWKKKKKEMKIQEGVMTKKLKHQEFMTTILTNNTFFILC